MRKRGSAAEFWNTFTQEARQPAPVDYEITSIIRLGGLKGGSLRWVLDSSSVWQEEETEPQKPLENQTTDVESQLLFCCLFDPQT